MGESGREKDRVSLFPLLIASTTFFLSYYTRLTWSILSVYMPFHPTVTQDAHVFALYFLGYVTMQVPAGFFSDRCSGGKIISGAMLLLALSTFISGGATSVYHEYLASLLMGVAAGWVYPASLKLIDNYYRVNRSLYIGYYSVAWPLAIVASGFFLPPIALHLGWRWGYLLPGLLCLLFAVLSFPLGTESGPGKKINWGLLKDREVLLVSLGGFLFFLSYWSITLYAYKYFVSIGINHVLAGYIFSAMAVVGLFSSSISGPIIDKVGLKRTVVLSLLLYGLITAAFAWVFHWVWLLVLALVMGFTRFIITPGNNNILVRIGKENVGAVTGIANMVWQSSGMVGPLLSALLIHNLGFAWFWPAIGAVVLLSIAFYASIRL
ncbi:MFS transporter [Desulfothermobacter acidiphilus]|uniref:MFS transporter n=1 Tax=Desulfothermobacter acidiphilus TaxID=1938353 RepID=UPI003F896E87